MRRRWYARWRLRKIERQWGYFDEMLIECLASSVGECMKQMDRLLKKEKWYKDRYHIV